MTRYYFFNNLLPALGLVFLTSLSHAAPIERRLFFPVTTLSQETASPRFFIRRYPFLRSLTFYPAPYGKSYESPFLKKFPKKLKHLKKLNIHNQTFQFLGILSDKPLISRLTHCNTYLAWNTHHAKSLCHLSMPLFSLSDYLFFPDDGFDLSPEKPSLSLRYLHNLQKFDFYCASEQIIHRDIKFLQRLPYLTHLKADLSKLSPSQGDAVFVFLHKLEAFSALHTLDLKMFDFEDTMQNACPTQFTTLTAKLQSCSLDMTVKLKENLGYSPFVTALLSIIAPVPQKNIYFMVNIKETVTKIPELPQGLTGLRLTYTPFIPNPKNYLALEKIQNLIRAIVDLGHLTSLNISYSWGYQESFRKHYLAHDIQQCLEQTPLTNLRSFFCRGFAEIAIALLKNPHLTLESLKLIPIPLFGSEAHLRHNTPCQSNNEYHALDSFEEDTSLEHESSQSSTMGAPQMDPLSLRERVAKEVFEALLNINGTYLRDLALYQFENGLDFSRLFKKLWRVKKFESDFPFSKKDICSLRKTPWPIKELSIRLSSNSPQETLKLFDAFSSFPPSSPARQMRSLSLHDVVLKRDSREANLQAVHDLMAGFPHLQFLLLKGSQTESFESIFRGGSRQRFSLTLESGSFKNFLNKSCVAFMT